MFGTQKSEETIHKEDTIHKENGIIKMREELGSVKKELKQGKHTCLVMRTEHPRAYKIC